MRKYKIEYLSIPTQYTGTQTYGPEHYEPVKKVAYDRAFKMSLEGNLNSTSVLNDIGLDACMDLDIDANTVSTYAYAYIRGAAMDGADDGWDARENGVAADFK